MSQYDRELWARIVDDVIQQCGADHPATRFVHELAVRYPVTEVSTVLGIIVRSICTAVMAEIDNPRKE